MHQRHCMHVGTWYMCAGAERLLGVDVKCECPAASGACWACMEPTNLLRLGSTCVRQQLVRSLWWLLKQDQGPQQKNDGKLGALDAQSRQARNHGRRHCGLPSRMAAFEEVIELTQKNATSWWRQFDRGQHDLILNSSASIASVSMPSVSNAGSGLHCNALADTYRFWKGEF